MLAGCTADDESSDESEIDLVIYYDSTSGMIQENIQNGAQVSFSGVELSFDYAYTKSTSGEIDSFPFSEGIVLTTGNALQAVGPETGDISSGDYNWQGDVDLANAVPGHDFSSSFNATYIQFDFIPLSNIISFNFIFWQYRKNCNCCRSTTNCTCRCYKVDKFRF